MQMLFLIAVIVVAAGTVSYVTSKNNSPQKQKPVALEDFEFPQIEEGTPQAVTFGDCWTEDWMVLGVGNYGTIKIDTKSGK